MSSGRGARRASYTLSMAMGKLRATHLHQSPDRPRVVMRIQSLIRTRSRLRPPPRATIHPAQMERQNILKTAETDQEPLGHRDVSTTMIYTYVLNQGDRGVWRPLSIG